MNLNWLRISGFTGCAALLLALSHLHAAAPGAIQQGYYGQDRDWDRVPDEWNDVQRRGFHDGIEGARRDFENHRQPDVNRRKEYRDADDVPPPMREAYRDAFRRGYDVGMSHFMGGAPVAQTYSQPPMDAPPDWFNDAQRRGFQDGMEGGRRDYENHREPDVNRRKEYREPNAPPELWGAYREGFRRGYQVAMARLTGTALPAAMPWNFVPPEYNEFERRGFQDGLEGAQRDYQNHRSPDVNRRKEYRDPDRIPPEMREAYREGFRRGYDVGWDHIMGRDHDRY